MEDVLQPGINQVAAGYLLYGSSNMLVYTTGKGATGFTYEPSLGEYFLSHQKITAPEGGNIYSINEGSYLSFEKPMVQFVEWCKEQARPYLDRGDIVNAIASMLSDLSKHEHTKSIAEKLGPLGLLHAMNHDLPAARRFIEGFT